MTTEEGGDVQTLCVCVCVCVCERECVCESMHLEFIIMKCKACVSLFEMDADEMEP